jgi:hypothetical protein
MNGMESPGLYTSFSFRHTLYLNTHRLNSFNYHAVVLKAGDRRRKCPVGIDLFTLLFYGVSNVTVTLLQPAVAETHKYP